MVDVLLPEEKQFERVTRPPWLLCLLCDGLKTSQATVALRATTPTPCGRGAVASATKLCLPLLEPRLWVAQLQAERDPVERT